MIYITGDTHGEFQRFSRKRFPGQDAMTKDDVMIIAGDFGGVWYGSGDTARLKSENWSLDELDGRAFTTLFVPGNHENYDRLMSDEFPLRPWKNGLVKVIRPSVLMLMRGEVYEIDGKRLFAFGGARSHDIWDGILDPADPDWKAQEKRLKQRKKTAYRVKGLTWWESEMPSREEMRRGLEALDTCGWEVDYVVTHCAPSGVQEALGRPETDDLTDYLEEIHGKLKYRQWFFGHYHRDQRIDSKDMLLYEAIVRVQ